MAAIAFGAFHLVGVLPVPDIPLEQVSVVLQNIIVGMVFGWFFWKYGLGSAMWTHFLLDIFFYVIMTPIFITGNFVLILVWLLLTVLSLIVSISVLNRLKTE